MVRSAHIILRIALAGVGLLLTGTVLLIFDVVVGHGAGLLAGSLTVVVVALIAALPLIVRLRGNE